jgi:hypothetical protein
MKPARAGGLTDQVVAFGDARSPLAGIRVRRGGGRQVAAEFVQVAADGVPPARSSEELADRGSRESYAAAKTIGSCRTLEKGCER